MQIVTTNMTVADYCNAMTRGEILVNRDYQRSDKVWPETAKSFLIETILMDYPIPKMSLHQKTDIRTRQTIKDIVDGQQRSTAIREFAENRLRLQRTLALDGARGRTYAELDGDLAARFLGYSLTFDLFIGVQPEEVREVFRRMNSFTVPLNPEEQRHAVYQGAFKWFIYRFSRSYDEALLEIGLFNQKQLVRFQDTKLFSELAHAWLNGISTTSKKKLDDLYRAKDTSFAEEDQLTQLLEGALDWLLGFSFIHNTSLMKPYLVYSLLIAKMYMLQQIPALAQAFAGIEFHGPSVQTQAANLTALAEALDDPDSNPHFRKFIDASSERTNVGGQREERARWFLRALTQLAL